MICRATGCGSIPRVARSRSSRAGARAGRNASPWAGMAISRPNRRAARRLASSTVSSGARIRSPRRQRPGSPWPVWRSATRWFTERPWCSGELQRATPPTGSTGDRSATISCRPLPRSQLAIDIWIGRELGPTPKLHYGLLRYAAYARQNTTRALMRSHQGPCSPAELRRRPGRALEAHPEGSNPIESTLRHGASTEEHEDASGS